jgi:hypothetical protein
MSPKRIGDVFQVSSMRALPIVLGDVFSRSLATLFIIVAYTMEKGTFFPKHMRGRFVTVGISGNN